MNKSQYKKFDLDILKMGYFILYKSSGGFFYNQITKEQIKRGFSKEDSLFIHIETSGGGPYSVAVIAPIIKVVNICEKHTDRYIKIVRFKGEDYDRKRYKVAFWSASACNRRYDWFGVLRFKFKLFFQMPWRHFCSENCLWALQKEYSEALEIAPADCLPADFLNERFFDVIWEGRINDK